jgi:hypothetical protein
MGKSSPTKLQLKHIPDIVVLQTIYSLQSQWTVWVGAAGEISTYRGHTNEVIPARKLSYRQKRTAHLSEIVEVLKPIPEKLIWRKLRKLEDRGLIEGYGPSGTHYRIVDS